MKDINITFRREELEMLPTPELEKILFEELESDSTDRDSVLQILSILEERDSIKPSDCPAGVETAWEKYLEERTNAVNDTPKVSKKPRKWQGFLAAAAVIALVLLMTVPQAVGADSIFDIIGRWTQDLFGFFHEDEPEVLPKSEYIFQTDHPCLQQVYDAVAAQGITQPVVPTWIPKGYEIVELKTTMQGEHGKKSKTIALLFNQDEYMVMSFEIYSESFSNSYPKDHTDATVYEYAGVDHYITSNTNTVKVMWSASNVECLIVLIDAEETLKSVIRSIYLEA